MHLADFSVGSLGESGIVASAMPVAVGAGLSAQMRGTDQVAVDNFFYDFDELFDVLDSDGSGELGRGDEFVGVRPVSFAGERATSTVIDVGGLIAEAEGAGDYEPGTGALTVFGATGLTADDIVGTF